MTQDPETCTVCPVVRLCDAWVPGGEWRHSKGRQPCRIQNEIIDAEEMQRVSLRREK
ncbi:MAG: hypothetical protein M0Q91_12740 [Methanoregula sp.]|nr:hypothetical protein [Methanoregula sp.]